ncbi:hypothetical protein RJ639_018593 [Escallonia herrerae]|uniref:NAC domain-containing protein n=1 Tax=Escallonia herrerae TaxID=1293975 RepID=A0AA89AI97_9ASTE|nr:hypothetical protein RJ639_018593 [Escallonia herrerae]
MTSSSVRVSPSPPFSPPPPPPPIKRRPSFRPPATGTPSQPSDPPPQTSTTYKEISISLLMVMGNGLVVFQVRGKVFVGVGSLAIVVATRVGLLVIAPMVLNVAEGKKDSENGFWKVKGKACEIFTNSTITGWRTTLEFYEGQAPHGRRTDWLIQEYGITYKGVGNNSKPKGMGKAVGQPSKDREKTWGLLKDGIKRIVFCDTDVHYGNDMQHMFWSIPDVLYFFVSRSTATSTLGRGRGISRWRSGGDFNDFDDTRRARLRRVVGKMWVKEPFFLFSASVSRKKNIRTSHPKAVCLIEDLMSQVAVLFSQNARSEISLATMISKGSFLLVTKILLHPTQTFHEGSVIEGKRGKVSSKVIEQVVKVDLVREKLSGGVLNQLLKGSKLMKESGVVSCNSSNKGGLRFKN